MAPSRRTNRAAARSAALLLLIGLLTTVTGLTGPASPANAWATMPSPSPSVAGTGTSGVIRVSWSRAAGRVRAYDVRNITLGKQVRVGASVRSYRWSGLENGRAMRFRVRPVRAAAGTWSAASVAVSAFGRPLATAAPAVTAEDGMVTAAWTWSSALGNGRSVSGFQVRLYRDGATATVVTAAATARSMRFGVENGHSYRVSVAGINPAGVGSASSPSAAVTPSGNPFPPGVSANGAYLGVDFALTAPPPNGRPIARLEWTDGSGWHTYSGPFTLPTSEGGQQRCIDARAVDTAGRAGAPARGCGTSDPKRVWITRGAQYTGPGCSGSCHYLVVQVSGFAPGTHMATLHPSPWCGDSSCPRSFTVDSSGRGSTAPYWWKQDGYLTNAYADVDGVASAPAGF